NAKIDTGAYTSSLHCSEILVEKDKVKFIVLDDEHPSFEGKWFCLPIEKYTVVKSSNGYKEERVVVKTTILLLGEEFDVFLTLTNRKDMKYPVLLGRKFLKDKYIVNVSLKHQ
ncbi:MAG: ATP-dependent zinc protease, partial [Crocinitomicaceae bacterium]